MVLDSNIMLNEKNYEVIIDSIIYLEGHFFWYVSNSLSVQCFTQFWHAYQCTLSAEQRELTHMALKRLDLRVNFTHFQCLKWGSNTTLSSLVPYTTFLWVVNMRGWREVLTRSECTPITNQFGGSYWSPPSFAQLCQALTTRHWQNLRKQVTTNRDSIFGWSGVGSQRYRNRIQGIAENKLLGFCCCCCRHLFL